MKKYNAIIIGSGSIGADKPDRFDSPRSKNVLTIANAFYRHPRIDFKGIVDSDKSKNKIAKKWGVEFTSNYIIKPIDIIAVCTPTETHYDIIKRLIESSACKVILAEKPLTNDLNRINILIDIQKQSLTTSKNTIKHIDISVDYIRRFCNKINDVKRKIDNGELGEIYSARVLYNRGIMRDGCHAIDLFNYFFGECNTVKVLGNYKIIDLSKDDPTVPVFFEYDKCKNVQLTPIDGRKWSVFEFEICAEFGRYVFTDHGKQMEFYPVKSETTYGNYNSLSYNRKVYKTDLTTALMTYVDNAVRILDGKDHIHSTIHSAKKVHCIYNSIKNQIEGKV